MTSCTLSDERAHAHEGTALRIVPRVMVPQPYYRYVRG